MTDEQNSKPEAAADPQGRLDALVMRLRRRSGLTEEMATDQEVLNGTEGTLGRAFEELDMASEKLGGVLREDIRETRKRMHARIGRFLRMFRDA